jgi:hypothetical protein
VLDAWASHGEALDVASSRVIERWGNLGRGSANGRETAALLAGVDLINHASIESRSVDELLQLLDALTSASQDVTTVAILLRRATTCVHATVSLYAVRPGWRSADSTDGAARPLGWSRAMLASWCTTAKPSASLT